jgi:hypothetical protein
LREDVEGEYMRVVHVPIQFYRAPGKSRDTVETMAPTKIEIDGKMYTLTPMNNNNDEENLTAENMQAMANYTSEGGAKKGKKGKKEKSGKTRKLSPYMKFAQDARKNIIAEHPDWKSDIIKVGKEIGARWRGLSDSEKAKY